MLQEEDAFLEKRLEKLYLIVNQALYSSLKGHMSNAINKDLVLAKNIINELWIDCHNGVMKSYGVYVEAIIDEDN